MNYEMDFMDIQNELASHFQSASSAPFLFIGSGFSRRYLGLEDWSNLLKRFSGNLAKPFEYYFSTANSDLPTVANLMSHDFHELWWQAPQFAESREKFAHSSRDRTSALRIEICRYLEQISISSIDPKYSDEIGILSRLNVDGIITTNWDLLLENLFPDFKVFVGQSEMILSQPQMIAEIYKIHGSITKPSSLVLTSNDYESFQRMNPYLAAKLITLFVEHPIVFIGYSLSDTNIISLLRSVVHALGPENLSRLQDNLIFIRRANNQQSSY